MDWDPSKWIILALHNLGLVQHLRRAREHDVQEAASYMRHIAQHGVPPESEAMTTWDGEVWDLNRIEDYIRENTGRCVLLIHGFVVDVTTYLGEHVSG